MAFAMQIDFDYPTSMSPGTPHAHCASAVLQRRQRGFTLIELMVTVSVLAILAALAAPSFITLIANQRVSSAAQEMQTLLQFARSQSVYKRTEITVTGSGQTWTVKAGSELLRQAELPGAVTLTPGTDSGDGVKFDAAGVARLISGAATQYALALAAPNATRMQCISVTRAGLVRQQRQPAGGSC